MSSLEGDTKSEISLSIAEVEQCFSSLKLLEQQLSTSNYEECIVSLFDARKKFVASLKSLQAEVVRFEFVPVKVVETLSYKSAVIESSDEVVVDLVKIDPQHRLVGMRVRLIEAWFKLKKIDEGHPLYVARRGEFIAVLEEAVDCLARSFDFDQIYEMYASDEAKLRSLVYSYFRKRSVESYIVEFNKHVKRNFDQPKLLRLLLREFAVYFGFKGVSG